MPCRPSVLQCRLFTLASLLVFSIGALAQSTREKQTLPQAELTTRTCSGTFNGVWDTLYGILTLTTAANGDVHATWVKKDVEHQPWGPDIVTAKVNGKILTGRYKNDWNKAEGTFEFRLADDGKSFTGGWTMTNHGGGAGGGPWPGTCRPSENSRGDSPQKDLKPQILAVRIVKATAPFGELKAVPVHGSFRVEVSYDSNTECETEVTLTTTQPANRTTQRGKIETITAKAHKTDNLKLCRTDQITVKQEPVNVEP